MIRKLERIFALSEKGARDLVKGFIACAVHNLTLFIPVGILYLLASDMLMNTLTGRGLFYVVLCIISVALIMASYRRVYKATYFSTYVESGVRRVSLAEKLRKIPLSYFGKKDLADITSTIMADAATLETGLSHWVPELIGAVISTTIAVLSIMFYDWRMGLAALWPIPVAILIVILSRNVQYSLSKRSMDAKMEVADGIQECIETMRDLKSCNAEKQYLSDHLGSRYCCIRRLRFIHTEDRNRNRSIGRFYTACLRRDRCAHALHVSSHCLPSLRSSSEFPAEPCGSHLPQDECRKDG